MAILAPPVLVNATSTHLFYLRFQLSTLFVLEVTSLFENRDDTTVQYNTADKVHVL